MTTDPYADSGAATFGPGSQTPVTPATPAYGTTEPYPANSGTTESFPTSDRTDYSGATTHGSSAGGASTKDKAADEAGQVKDTAVDAAQQVAGTAKDEAGNVVGEAKAQASNLLDQVKGEAGSQAETQQQRLAGIVGSYAKELGSMASGSDESGQLTDLAHQASQRAGEAAHWLENHKPAELLDEVRSFARRRPGAFLLSAAVAGVVVGRLTRGAVAEAKSDDSAPVANREIPAGARYSEPVQTGYTPQVGYTPEAVGYDRAPDAGFSGETTGPDAGYVDSLADRPLTDQAPGEVIR